MDEPTPPARSLLLNPRVRYDYNNARVIKSYKWWGRSVGAVLNAASGVCFNLMSSGVNLQEGGEMDTKNLDYIKE